MNYLDVYVKKGIGRTFAMLGGRAGPPIREELSGTAHPTGQCNIHVISGTHPRRCRGLNYVTPFGVKINGSGLD
jgi:hypothetical protein